MWDVAYAQAGGGPSTFISMLPLVLIFAVFYFLLIRPQQRKARDHRSMLAQLKRNDDVMTTGGVLGKVQALSEDRGDPGSGVQRENQGESEPYRSALQRRKRQTGAKEVKGK